MPVSKKRKKKTRTARTSGSAPRSADLATIFGGYREPKPRRPLPRHQPPGQPTRYQLRIELLGADPAIWRGLSVPSAVRLDRLHWVLQSAMGWDDDHLHMFSLADDPYRSDLEAIVGEFSSEPGVPESDLRLDELITAVGDKISYLYDFGDDWLHRLTLESIATAEPDDEGVGAVLAGDGACPPEDSGGIWGYQELLHASKQPRDQLDEELVERLDWYGMNDRVFNLAAADATVRRIGNLLR